MDKILALIPEVYYDIIARILPGIIFVLVVIPSNLWEVMSQKDILTNSALLLFLVSGYICGFVLDACSASVEAIWDKGRLWSKLDKIEDKDKAKASRPIKLVSEVVLLRVLLLGWLIVGLRLEIFLLSPVKYNWFIYFIIAAILVYLYRRWYLCTMERLSDILSKQG
jgi:hypothetical protein